MACAIGLESKYEINKAHTLSQTYFFWKIQSSPNFMCIPPPYRLSLGGIVGNRNCEVHRFMIKLRQLGLACGMFQCFPFFNFLSALDLALFGKGIGQFSNLKRNPPHSNSKTTRDLGRTLQNVERPGGNRSW